MERTLITVYRCPTCDLRLEGEDESNEHEKKHGHKVKRTEIIIVPPRITGSRGFNLKCVTVGAPAEAQQGTGNIRPPPQSNMFVLTAGGQCVRHRVQTLQGQLIGATKQVTARVPGPRPVVFFSKASGAQGSPQQMPTAEATVEIHQVDETVEREEVVQYEETVERQEVQVEPQEAGSSGVNQEKPLTEPQLEFIRNSSQTAGGGKAPTNKRVLRPVRSNPLNSNKGGRRNFS